MPVGAAAVKGRGRVGALACRSGDPGTVVDVMVLRGPDAAVDGAGRGAAVGGSARRAVVLKELALKELAQRELVEWDVVARESGVDVGVLGSGSSAVDSATAVWTGSR
ncbi:hypothetical protein Aglo03_64690 [Actinokineospora globicatena]|uniref:Uncharacterized protein n=1 Tax=Actinokineospora globicatena TaxID=103729 RepID=A0A9W6QV44_9PSEU|nr:hypothetical protein Aglo03_64690 [Actinokineospora globicatena]